MSLHNQNVNRKNLLLAIKKGDMEAVKICVLKLKDLNEDVRMEVSHLTFFSILTLYFFSFATASRTSN